MGIFLTLLFILTTYLTPTVVFGQLGLYHMQTLIAIPTMLIAFSKLGERGISRKSQTWAAAGMLFAVFMSFVFNGMTRSAPGAVMDFLPSVMGFFFVACIFHKKSHLQLLTAVLFFVALFVIVQSQIAEKNQVLEASRLLPAGMDERTYYILYDNALGEKFYRIQGLGIIGDPNDFGQFMMGLMPCLLFSWAKDKGFLNVIRVYAPIAIVMIGIFLTHSRGALLAVAAVVMFVFRKKIGLIPAAVGGVVMLGGMMAAGFTGGRDVSASAGEDRMAAWSTGLQLVRSHPLFGVGYYHFTDYYYITAHNTIVVCAAEIGVIGFFFWVVFVFSSIWDGYIVSTAGLEDVQAKKEEASGPARLQARHAPAPGLPNLAFAGPKLAPAPASSLLLDHTAIRSAPSTFLRPGNDRTKTAVMAQPDDGAQKPAAAVRQAAFATAAPSEQLSHDEIRRMASLVVLSFVGLLVTGWFLSRAFAMVFFIYGGIAAVLFRMAREAGMEVPLLNLGRAAKLSMIATIVLLGIVDIILRADHLIAH